MHYYYQKRDWALPRNLQNCENQLLPFNVVSLTTSPVFLSSLSLCKLVTPSGGGVEYLHRSPVSRRRRRKGNPVPGGITGPLCSWGGLNTETWSYSVGESRIWDSKIREWVPRDSDQRMTALARTSSNCKRQTHYLVREVALRQQTRNSLAVTKIWSGASDGSLTPRQTYRLTAGCNIILTKT
jgi:hypothetical protein